MGVGWREWSETRTDLERGRVRRFRDPTEVRRKGVGEALRKEMDRGLDRGQYFNRRLSGRKAEECVRFSGRRATGKTDLHFSAEVS